MSQRYTFSEAQLTKFPTSHFPEIPAEHSTDLIRGTVADAMFANRLHFLVERNRVSTLCERRLMAINTGCNLSCLNQGLHPEPVRVKELISPAIITTVEVDTWLTVEKPPTGHEVINLANLHTP